MARGGSVQTFRLVCPGGVGEAGGGPAQPAAVLTFARVSVAPPREGREGWRREERGWETAGGYRSSPGLTTRRSDGRRAAIPGTQPAGSGLRRPRNGLRDAELKPSGVRAEGFMSLASVLRSEVGSRLTGADSGPTATQGSKQTARHRPLLQTASASRSRQPPPTAPDSHRPPPQTTTVHRHRPPPQTATAHRHRQPPPTALGIRTLPPPTAPDIRTPPPPTAPDSHRPPPQTSVL